MKRSTWVPVLLAAAALVVMGAAGVLLLRSGIGPHHQEDLSQPRIYAYRDWQSIGLYVKRGDRIQIRAQGTWLYTPGEYHGPEGHAYYPAISTYPIDNVPGGVLLGRFGEEGGHMFIVGRGCTVWPDREGLLYFRINDDILTDNEGYVTIEVVVTTGEETVEPQR